MTLTIILTGIDVEDWRGHIVRLVGPLRRSCNSASGSRCPSMLAGCTAPRMPRPQKLRRSKQRAKWRPCCRHWGGGNGKKSVSCYSAHLGWSELLRKSRPPGHFFALTSSRLHRHQEHPTTLWLTSIYLFISFEAYYYITLDRTHTYSPVFCQLEIHHNGDSKRGYPNQSVD
jgi:hypothetical protein